MKNTIKTFYQIIGNTVDGCNIICDENEVEVMESIAYNNTCLPIFCEKAHQLGISASSEARKAVFKSIAYNYKNLAVQDKVINMLNDNGIKCAVIKGTSCSVTYDDPMLRFLGDIDILVSEEDYEKSIDVFVSDRNLLSEMHSFHYQFKCDGMTVEIHRAVTDFEENEQQIEQYMKDALDDLDFAELEAYKFPILKSKYQVIMLLLHTKRHYFENALTTKLLYDWGMFIEKTDAEYWKKSIVPLLKNFNLLKLADALSSICNDFMNILCEDKIESKLNIEVIKSFANKFVTDRCPELKENVVKKKSIFKTIHFINNIAYRDYQITKKCKVILPVFWFIIGIRFIYRRKIGFRGKVDIMEFSQEWYDKEMIFEQIYK